MATLAEQYAELQAKFTALEAQVKQPVYPANNALGTPFNQPWVNNGAPTIRKGEDSMSSRPFRFLKLFGAISGKYRHDEAKLELNCLKSFESGLRNYAYAPCEGGVSAPLGMAYLPDEFACEQSNRVLKSLITYGAAGADPEEIEWTRTKAYSVAANKGHMPSRMKATQSWLDETLGGPLVAPPEFGEIIELLRNQEALVNAGARTIQLPAQGTIVFPRITSPSTAGTYSENTAIASSTVGTGHLTLSAKKIAAIIQVPNELFRFATAAAEAVLRADMTKTLALQADLYFLEGNGTNANVPRGILNYPNIVSFTAGRTGANGDTLLPEDGYAMEAQIEENNAMLEGWIMRPTLWNKIGGFRADAVTAGDKAGVFVQSLFRAMGDKLDPAWCGHPITKTNQVSRSRQKGTSTNLTYILGGMWSDYLIGLFGAIEFLATNVADTPFQNDLTWIRGIMLGDAGPRHEAAFVKCDNLIRV